MNVEDLTLGEVEEIEQYAGKPLATLADGEAAKGSLMVALAWVIGRKENPNMTLNDAKKMTMSEITELLNVEDPKAK
jgi:hypothetical protein